MFFFKATFCIGELQIKKKIQDNIYIYYDKKNTKEQKKTNSIKEVA